MTYPVWHIRCRFSCEISTSLIQHRIFLIKFRQNIFLEMKWFPMNWPANWKFWRASLDIYSKDPINDENFWSILVCRGILNLLPYERQVNDLRSCWAGNNCFRFQNFTKFGMFTLTNSTVNHNDLNPSWDIINIILKKIFPNGTNDIWRHFWGKMDRRANPPETICWPCEKS